MLGHEVTEDFVKLFVEEFSMKMRIAVCCLLASLAITATVIAADPQAKPEPKPTFASVLDHQLSNTEKTVVPAAEAMPEDKYSFAPTPGRVQGRARLRSRSQAHGSGQLRAWRCDSRREASG